MPSRIINFTFFGCLFFFFNLLLYYSVAFSEDEEHKDWEPRGFSSCSRIRYFSLTLKESFQKQHEHGVPLLTYPPLFDC